MLALVGSRPRSSWDYFCSTTFWEAIFGLLRVCLLDLGYYYCICLLTLEYFWSTTSGILLLVYSAWDTTICLLEYFWDTTPGLFRVYSALDTTSGLLLLKYSICDTIPGLLLLRYYAWTTTWATPGLLYI